MKITMPRGDLRFVKFSIKNKDESVSDIDLDEIYITFKERYSRSDFLFQKKLSDNTIIKDENNYYNFSINPEDTNDLSMGTSYDFDIELIKEGTIKQTICGELYLTKEVTHADNEVSL